MADTESIVPNGDTPTAGTTQHQLLAKWSLGIGIVATIGTNLAHDVGHGTVGALVGAWLAVARASSYELLTVLSGPNNVPPRNRPEAVPKPRRVDP